MKDYHAELIANIKAGDLATANVEKWEPSTWPAEAKGAGPCEAPRGRARALDQDQEHEDRSVPVRGADDVERGPRDAKGQSARTKRRC